MSQRTRERTTDLPHLAVQVHSRATEATVADDAGHPLRCWWVQTTVYCDRLMTSSPGKRPDDQLFEQGVLVRAGDDLWSNHHALCRTLETAGRRCRRPTVELGESEIESQEQGS